MGKMAVPQLQASSFPLPPAHPGQGRRDLLSPSYKVPLLRPESRWEPQFCPHHSYTQAQSRTRRLGATSALESAAAAATGLVPC